MTLKRGEVWLADLNPIRGSEQAGIRPILPERYHQRLHYNRRHHPVHH